MTNTLNSIHSNKNKINQKPMVVLFCGPTGVGKTELAKATSLYISSEPNETNQERIAIFNMEKYTNEHHGDTLFGTSLGYVSSQDKPLFSKSVDCYASRDSHDGEIIIKNVVLLFDEIEKANNTVRQTLLTLLDNGKLELIYTQGKDNVVQKYHFQNCIFVATSNLLSKVITADFENNLPDEEIANHFHKLASQHHPIDNPRPFSSEWLGRVTIVPFRPINKGDEFQRVIENNLIEILRETETKHSIKASIDLHDKALILQTIENQHYNGGVSIRTFKNNLRIAFDHIFSRLRFDFDDTSEATTNLMLIMDKSTNQVAMKIELEELGETQVIDQDEKGDKFFLTSSHEITKEGNGQFLYGTSTLYQPKQSPMNDRPNEPDQKTAPIKLSRLTLVFLRVC